MRSSGHEPPRGSPLHPFMLSSPAAGVGPPGVSSNPTARTQGFRPSGQLRGAPAPRWLLPRFPVAGARPIPSTSTTSGGGGTTISRSTTRATWRFIPGGPAASRPSTSRSWSTRCGERGIGLPLLIRFSDDPQGPGRRAERGLRPRHRRVRLQGHLPRRLPDQGQPGPLRGRGDRRVRPAVPLRPRGGLEARAARRHGDAGGRGGAHHLQRLQGRGVHRDGAPRREARPHGDHGRREALGAAADRARSPGRWACGRASAFASRLSARGAGPLGGLGRRPLEVRPLGARAGRGHRPTCARTSCSTRFELLHFHLGSQISAIRAVKDALREAGRFYVELVKLGAPLELPRRRRRPRASTTTARRRTSPRR